MELQEVEVMIGKDGRVEIRVRGVKGAACLELTSELEALLGSQIEAREMTAEAYENVAVKTTNQQKSKAS